MCQYCTTFSSEFEHFDLSDSLSSIKRSQESDIRRVDPNLLISTALGNVTKGHINWSEGNETLKYFIYDYVDDVNIDIWDYDGTSNIGTETATTVAHNNDSKTFIRSIFYTLDSLIDLDFEEVYSFDDSDLDILSVSDYSHFSESTIGMIENGKNEWNVLWKNTDINGPLNSNDKNTIIHEIGHALGLSHPNEDPYNIEWNTVEDTVMSYNSLSGIWGYEFTRDDNSALVSIWNLENDDTTSPTVTFFSPLDDSTAVATTSNIVLTFSEAVDVETGNIVIYKASDNSVVEIIDVTSSKVTGSGTNQITINPVSDLAESTAFYVQIAGTAFDDSSSNSYSGISDTTSFSFTTADETAPTISSFSPLDDSTAVATTSNIVLTFSEAVDVETGNIVIYKASDNSVVEIIDVTSSKVTGSGTNQITINPVSDLAESTAFYVQIAGTAFDDSSSNSYSGISDTTSFSFTTADETAPTISSFSQLDDASGSINILSINENGTSINTFKANETVTWSLNGGADASLFSISSLGALSFSFAPDYESPKDSDSNNDYVVGIRATDASGNTSVKTVTVKVENNQELDISSHQVGTSYNLAYIKDYDGNLHANTGIVSNATKSAYKYQGLIDVNADGTKEAIYTNKESGRWVTGSINSSGEIDYEDHGLGGTTRVVGIYLDPLVQDGVVEQFGPYDSQQRFQTDLSTENLTIKASGDYDGDGFQEVYWKTDIGGAYLRALMHADGNMQYANYQNEEQMSDYLTSKGYESVISDIV